MSLRTRESHPLASQWKWKITSFFFFLYLLWNQSWRNLNISPTLFRFCHSPCMAAVGSASHGCSVGSQARRGHKGLLHVTAGAAGASELAAGPTRGGRTFLWLVPRVARRNVCFERSASFYLFSLEQIQWGWQQQSVGNAARRNMSDPRGSPRKRWTCCKHAVPLQTPLCLFSSPHFIRNERTRGSQGAPGLPQHHRRGPGTWWGGTWLRSLHCTPLTLEHWDKGEGPGLAEALTGHPSPTVASAPARSCSCAHAPVPPAVLVFATIPLHQNRVYIHLSISLHLLFLLSTFSIMLSFHLRSYQSSTHPWLV